MRYFSRRHRCITYSARGYLPSAVPAEAKDYTYKHWASDAIAILDHLKVDKAHVVGLSMGGFTVVVLGMLYPDRLLSLTAAGARWYRTPSGTSTSAFGSGAASADAELLASHTAKTASFRRDGLMHVKTPQLAPRFRIGRAGIEPGDLLG